MQLGPEEIQYALRFAPFHRPPGPGRCLVLRSLRPALGLDYEWYNALIGAACGDYQRAGQFLEDYIQRVEHVNIEGALRLLEMQTFQGGMSPGLSPGSLYGVLTMPGRIGQVADYRVLRGLLALEEGENAVAAKYFQSAVDASNPKAFAFESRPIADRYLQLIKEAGGVKSGSCITLIPCILSPGCLLPRAALSVQPYAEKPSSLAVESALSHSVRRVFFLTAANQSF